jgi:hypothetical protein
MSQWFWRSSIELDYISSDILKYYGMLKTFIYIWLGVSFIQRCGTQSTIGNNQTYVWTVLVSTFYPCNVYRLSAVVKVETDIITRIAASPKGRDATLVILYVDIPN